MSENRGGTLSDGEPSSAASRIGGEAQGRESVRQDLDDRGYAVSTYRYLRLAIVTVIFALVASVLLERSQASCWQGAISAYYYTPVHSIFVAALGVIGVALFAIRGGTMVEEVLLNMAGFLAPVVAFVPTGWSSGDCPSNLPATLKQTIDKFLTGNHFFAKFSTNNLVSLIIAGVIAIFLAGTLTLILSRKAGRPARTTDRFVKELAAPALGSVLVVIAGFIWRKTSPETFSTHAHSYSAILMFVLVGIVMLSTAERDGSPFFKTLYFACPSVMLAAGIVVGVVGALVKWHHEVLVLEIIELTAFVVFWFFQTIQLWDEGLRASDEPEGDGPLRRLSLRVMDALRPGGSPQTPIQP